MQGLSIPLTIACVHLLGQDDDDLLRRDAGARAVARSLQALEALADDERVRLGEEAAARKGLWQKVAPDSATDEIVLDGEGEDCL